MSTPLPHEPQRAIDPTRESFKALLQRPEAAVLGTTAS